MIISAMSTSAKTEKELILRFSEGDNLAFEEIFHIYRNRIYVIALRMTGKPATAEEIVQDVFLKVWLKRQALPEVTHFRAWLFTVARNHIFTEMKRLAREQGMEMQLRQLEPVHYEQTDVNVCNKDYDRILRKAVERLPPQQVRIYKLSKEEGLPRNEIADRLHLSPETVKVHLANAMRSIRAYCLAQIDFHMIICLFWLF